MNTFEQQPPKITATVDSKAENIQVTLRAAFKRERFKELFKYDK